MLYASIKSENIKRIRKMLKFKRRTYELYLMSTVQSPKSIGTMEQYPKMPIA
jgi:hypothetical protein